MRWTRSASINDGDQIVDVFVETDSAFMSTCGISALEIEPAFTACASVFICNTLITRRNTLCTSVSNADIIRRTNSQTTVIGWEQEEWRHTSFTQEDCCAFLTRWLTSSALVIGQISKLKVRTCGLTAITSQEEVSSQIRQTWSAIIDCLRTTFARRNTWSTYFAQRNHCIRASSKTSVVQQIVIHTAGAVSWGVETSGTLAKTDLSKTTDTDVVRVQSAYASAVQIVVSRIADIACCRVKTVIAIDCQVRTEQTLSDSLIIFLRTSTVATTIKKEVCRYAVSTYDWRWTAWTVLRTVVTSEQVVVSLDRTVDKTSILIQNTSQAAQT